MVQGSDRQDRCYRHILINVLPTSLIHRECHLKVDRHALLPDVLWLQGLPRPETKIIIKGILNINGSF